MNKTTVYTTIENQFRSDGTYGLLFNHWNTKEKAEEKFFTVCAANAANEDLPYCLAMIIADDGRIIRKEIFDRRTATIQTSTIEELSSEG